MEDDARAHQLVQLGTPAFINQWYASSSLWDAFRRHPTFARVCAARSANNNAHGLATALASMSTGRQVPLWGALGSNQWCCDMLVVVGAEDDKFRQVAAAMVEEMHGGGGVHVVEMPACGHAVHVEDPMGVAWEVLAWLERR